MPLHVETTCRAGLKRAGLLGSKEIDMNLPENPKLLLLLSDGNCLTDVKGYYKH